MWIKICGLSKPDTVDAAVAAGADAVGFVFAAGSPREVTPEVARSLVARVPVGIETVGVFRDQPTDEILRSATAAGLSAVQLHGHEGPEIFEAVRSAGFPTIRALSAASFAAESPDATARYGDVRLLLDAPDPGAGTPFDASALDDFAPPEGWILAGGLTPENVSRLTETLAPSGVDVSSGVESARGVKDVSLIKEFVARVRSA